MEDLSKYTSLQRYVLTRGRFLVGPSTSLKGLNIQFGIGAGLVAISVLMMIGGVLASVRGVEIAAIGPFIAGTINAVVAWTLKCRLGQSPAPATNLSAEARTMLSRLTWAYIWSKNPWGWSMQMSQTDAGQQCQWGMPQGQHYAYGWGLGVSQRSLSTVPPEVLDRMEEAASHYNRISGALEAGKSAGTLQRLRPKIVQGADEAMLDVLSQAQLVSQYPEGAKAIQGRLTGCTATLKELGDRVEAMTLREPTFTDMMAGRTMADEVLEELRLEQSAFTELSSQEDGPRNHLQA